ncbi:hypothetical protein HWV62_33549 [Athelia sp. TMB]|nr:hypothetical protein HWV62_33549 [Athelia sp. TMB]
MTSLARPAWQTEDLEDEWIEEEDEDDGSRSISLTTPLANTLHVVNSSGNNSFTSEDEPNAEAEAGGTFLVRQDVPAAPLLPKTPGRNPMKGAINTFFSPLPLERMFEPPSPPPASVPPPAPISIPNKPAVSSRLVREYVPSEGEPSVSHSHIDAEANDGVLAVPNQPFTFTVLRQPNLSPAQAQSTPLPPAPMTDPRLKLFQFQYDTFTRDHLSAIVDSIPVNTPSGGRGSPFSGADSETPGNSSISHLRSAKRMRLSPASDFSGYGEGDGEGALIARPKLQGQDYVGESRRMMDAIKSARDFSTISTTSSARALAIEEREEKEKEAKNVVEARPALLTVPTIAHPSSSPGPNPLASSTASTSRLEKYSSLAYRKQAADLMAAIKNDVQAKTTGRSFSAETDVTDVTNTRRGKENGWKGHVRGASSTSTVFTKASRQTSRTHTVGGSSPARPARSPKKGASPRRIRKPQIIVDDDLAGGLRDMSLEEQGHGTVRISKPPQTRPPIPAQSPAGLLHPMGSLRGAEDLNRFVSSSTVTSGTTLATQSTGSTRSFVKHGHAGVGGMRRIGPEEVQGMLGDRVGRMVFDSVLMKWVKGVPGREGTYEADRGAPEHTRTMSVDSEDPFRDIESLRDDGDATRRQEDAMSRITETEREVEADNEEADAEEAELNSFSFDGAGVVHVMTGIDSAQDDDLTTDSEDEEDQLVTETDREHEQDLGDGDGFDSDEELPEALRPQPFTWSLGGTSRASPARRTHAPSPAKTPRSPKNMMKSRSTTPVSALKGGSGPRNHRTPANRMGHRRSVSFSDGKREGPIRGVGKDGTAPEQRSIVFVPSARSKRIADMMEDLESSEFVGEDSPTKSSASSRRTSVEMRPLRKVGSSSPKQDVSRRVFSRSQTQRHSPDNASHVKANATFLTECSFGVSHDRLVQVITDVEPFEPHWETISSIDLSKKNVESVARLKEFLPKLDSLCFHLLNLENLDLSNNDIDCLRQLECLRHLRELRADGNKITSLDGLQKMDGLAKLSLQKNGVKDVDLARYHWTRLEMLNLSGNKIEGIDGLASLPSLIALNLDHNSLGDFETGGPMPRLRILRVSGNRLRRLNVASFPNLRTLYADNNALTSLVKADRLAKLENLSLRNQNGKGFHLSTREIRDVKRLYLSGNALQGGFIEEPCYNLVYLELAACRLSTLPANMAQLAPNLRVLNLNYNFIEDARPLEGLTRLKKLTLIGSRLAGTKPLIRVLERMGDVEMLDFRMNPCTLGWYLPLLVRDVPGALQPSDKPSSNGGGGKDLGWKDLDAKFRRDLPDAPYIGRLAYRGLVMRACPRIRMLDGVDVTEKERVKASHLLEGISRKRKGAGGSAVVAT